LAILKVWKIDNLGEVQSISDLKERNEKLQDIASYNEDLKFLTVPFGVQDVRSYQSRNSNPTNQSASQSRMSNNSTVIFAREVQ
jgi:hypothetical protein